MRGFLQGGARRELAIAGIALTLVLFLAVNLLANTVLTQARLDLTEHRLHTLSEGTHATLARIPEPITLRLYISDELGRETPALADHARRVRELLEHYARLADGGIELRILRPAPFSPEEDRAMADGLEGVPLGPQGRPVFFGLAGGNSTDDREAIAFFAPERAAFLEYELTRLIARLADPRELRLGVVGALPLDGDRHGGGRPWQVLELMRQDHDVRLLDGALQDIRADIDILVLAQPSGLPDSTLYAVDQFVQRGGKVLAFADPFSEALARQAPDGSALPEAAGIDAGLRRLLASWGVAVAGGEVVADRGYARRVRSRVGGRDGLVDFVGWLAVPGGGLSPENPVTAPLSELSLRTPGRIEPLDGADAEIEPLALSSREAMTLPAARLRGFPDPARLLADFEATGERYTLAARIAGPPRSAFPDGPPDSIADPEIRAAHRDSPESPPQILLVADSDILADDAWLHRGDSGGGRRQPYADNGDFLVNALEHLGGGSALMELRGRGRVDRPFTLIEEMRRDAESRYRSREQQLVERIREGQERIRSLRQQERDTGRMLDAAGRAEIESLQQEMLDARAELREVQHRLHADVERVKARVRLANILGMPALVAAAALALALLRRRRRAHRPAAAG